MLERSFSVSSTLSPKERKSPNYSSWAPGVAHHAEEFFDKEWRAKHGDVVGGKSGNVSVADCSTRVSSPSNDALRDGPALTIDGRAVELDGGFAIHFSYDRSMADSEQNKKCLKDGVRLMRAVRRAHAACTAEAQIEDGEVCAIDADGVLQGFLPSPAQAPPDVAARLKKFRAKAMLRRSADRDGTLACVGPDGRAFMCVKVPTTRERRHQLERKRAGRVFQGDASVGETLVLSADGVVHLD